MKNSASYLAYKRSPKRSIKHSTYFAVYDELMSRFRNRPITFVEVGVLGGGSLFMWREFFGRNARIIGIDVNPAAKKWEKEGFEIFIGSQADPEFWESFVAEIGSVDILLDDGGHTYDQQITTVEMMLDSIRDGGLLIVEDTHTSYMSGFGPRRYTFMRYVSVIADRLNSRFGGLHGRKIERRVWSVHIYESIVAFAVNREAAGLVSEPTDNGGTDDGAEDLRYKDVIEVAGVHKVSQSLVASFGSLAEAPVIQAIRRSVAPAIASLRFKSRKYFK